MIKLGLMLGDEPLAVSPSEQLENILRIVEAGQEAGAKHFLIGQHFLFDSARWLQPVPILSRLAAETDADVRLATQILISPLYHPVLLAEELATLDIVTGGRLDIGLGLGYRKLEYEALGIPFDERIPRFEAGIELMRALWSSDSVSFDGEFWQLDEVPVHIRPLQSPHPPLWLGAQSNPGIRRAARFGDSWPITPHVRPAQLAEKIGIFAAERERVGKELPTFPLRREIFVADSHAAAKAEAVEKARPWFQGMAAVGSREIDQSAVESEMDTVVSGSFVLGSPEECAAQIGEIARSVPVGPIVTRATWPGMSGAEAVAYVQNLGEKLVPALGSITAISPGDFDPTGA